MKPRVCAATILHCSTILFLAHASAWAAPGLEAGSVRASPGATVELPVYFTSGGSSVAGLQLDLRFDSARLSAQAPSPGAAVLDHVLANATPAAGTFRALVYSLAKAPLTSGALLSVPFTVAVDAQPGDVPLVLENALLSDAAAVKVIPAGLVPGIVKIVAAPPVGQTLSLDGTASDGRPDRTALLLTGLGSVEVLYRLGAAPGGTCQVKLTIVKPDGSKLSPLVLATGDRRVQTNGLDGSWTFLLSTAGGCSATAYHLEIRPLVSVVGVEAGLLFLGSLALLAVLRRRAGARADREAYGRRAGG